MKQKQVSESAEAAVIATRDVIRSGDVGLDFTSPDDATIQWTPEGIAAVMAAIVRHRDSRAVLADMINELLAEAGAEQHQLLEDHPEWGAEMAEFEAEEREWQAERDRDVASRVHDMNAGMLA